MMDKSLKIYIAGGTGMVGSAIHRALKRSGHTKFVFTPYPAYDLTRQEEVEKFFEKEKPDYVINAAAKVGGIYANNKYRAQFIYENIIIESNIVHAAHLFDVKKLLFLGSSCIYPRESRQPIQEEYLLTGILEKTNEPYAIAKIAGIKLCENYFRQYGSNFISVMPTNLYGSNDNYDLETAHVIPALIRKFHEAKQANDPAVKVWGSGNPRREFLYVDDMAEACVFLLNNIDAQDLYGLGVTHLNIGTGIDYSIRQVAELIKSIVGYEGQIHYDPKKPDGTPRKLLDVTRIRDLGWESKMDFPDGIKKAYTWYLNSQDTFRK
jgi:GDP-L-fucose synthase